MSPNNWPWLELEQVAQVTAGNPAPQGDEYFLEGKRPFVRVQDLGRLDGASHLRETVDLVNEKASATLRLFPKGSVLFTKSGASLLLNQRAILGADMHVVSHIGVAIPGPRISSEWLYYWLRTVDFADFSHGANMPSLPLSRVKKISIPVPSLDEQRVRIAEIEKQFSRLDEAVANLKRVKAKLKRYKAAVLKSAVEGRLVETEAELARRRGCSYETGEQLLRRALKGRNSSSKARQSMAGMAVMPSASLREIPGGWTWTTTGQVCECIVPNRDKPKTFTGDIPWLTMPDFDDSEITVARSRSGLGFTESEVELYRAKAIPTDSVVMSCVGRFGISAVLTRKAVINQQLHAFLPSEGVVPKYLAYVLRTREQEMLEKSTATTIAYLNKENCNSISVPLPPLAEQTRIVAEVDRHLSIVREVEAEVDTNLRRGQALRQATLHRAFFGT